MSLSSEQQKLEFLRGKIYNAGYAFPKWAIKKCFENNKFIMREARIYYDEEDEGRLEDVIRLVKEREPVNITRERHYDVDLLEEKFGWKTGYYDRYYEEHKKLAPNIAVYTPTYIEFEGEITSEVYHVINVIGCAFDSKKQSDYKYYSRKKKETMSKEVGIFYQRVFRKIYACSKKKKLSTVVMSLFGGNRFAQKYPDGGVDGFLQKVWIPAFGKTYCIAEEYKLDVKFMGSIPEIIKKRLKKIQNIGLFPNDIIKNVVAESTLIVNSWDMLSLPGSGNVMRKYTNIAVNGSGMTNKYFEYKNSYVIVKKEKQPDVETITVVKKKKQLDVETVTSLLNSNKFVPFDENFIEISKKGDKNSRGQTLLYFLCRFRPETASLVINTIIEKDKNFDINKIKNENGDLPQHGHCWRHKTEQKISKELMKVLKKAKANFDEPNNNGETPKSFLTSTP